jgi:hypothetical protein
LAMLLPNQNKIIQEVIALQVSCDGIVNSRLTYSILERFPHVKYHYYKICQHYELNPYHIYGMSISLISQHQIVALMFTKLAHGDKLDYKYLRRSLKMLRLYSAHRGYSVAFVKDSESWNLDDWPIIQRNMHEYMCQVPYHIYE